MSIDVKLQGRAMPAIFTIVELNFYHDRHNKLFVKLEMCTYSNKKYLCESNCAALKKYVCLYTCVISRV